MKAPLLLFTVLFAALLGGHLSPVGGITSFFFLTALLFICVGPDVKIRRDELASLCFAFFGAFSVLYAKDTWGAVLFSGSFVAGALFYVVLRNSAGWQPMLLKALVIAGCISGLIEALRQVNLMPYSLFYNPNPFSGFLAPLVPLAIYLYARKKEKRYAAASILLIFANFISGSRTGVLGMLLALVAILLYFLNQKDRAAVRALFLFFVVAFASFLLFSQAKDVLMIKSIDGLLEKKPTNILQRWSLLKVTLDVILQAPVLGHGLNCFRPVMNSLSNPYVLERTTHAHSLYLNLLAELGMVGLALFLLFLWLVLRGPFRSSFFLKIALLSFLFHNIVEYNFPAPVFQVLFYLLCAAIVAEKEPGRPVFELRRWALRGAQGAVALCFLVLSLFPLIGFFLVGRADAAYQRGDIGKTLKYLHASTSFGYSVSSLHENEADFINHVYVSAALNDPALLVRAEKSYLRAISLSRLGGDLYLKVADFYMKSGRSAEAERMLRTIVEKCPFHQQYRLMLARFLVGQARYAEAIQTLERIDRFLEKYVPLHPMRFDALAGLAAAYQKLGDAGRAEYYRAEARQLQSAIAATEKGTGK